MKKRPSIKTAQLLLQFIYLRQKLEEHNKELQIHDEEIKNPDDDDRWILCSLCQNHITKPKEKTSINNQHIYSFTNPQGITYDIKCYKTAPGCISFSQPTEQFTWFPGYAWEIIICSQCRMHLGWKYSSAKDNFYGLIYKRLIEN